MQRVIDEKMAVRAATVVAPVPRTDPDAAARLRSEVAADLDAVDAAARDWTGLGADLPPTRVRIVSRAGWVRANLAGMRGAFDPLAERLQTVGARRRLTAGAVGAQVGALLGLLSTKVLGQYVLPLGGPGQAQLVLVGPNLLDLSNRYGALAADVRRIVLLHELAHRLQFDAVAWLGDHLRGLLARYLDAAELDAEALLDLLARLPEVARALRSSDGLNPILRAVLNEEQLAIITEAQALMSLLEGHGNATMYLASEGLVADPDKIRDALEARRGDRVGRLLNAVAGMDMKRRQYQEGERFVRRVVEIAGTSGLNRAFDDPENLPSPDEIADADVWLARVS